MATVGQCDDLEQASAKVEEKAVLALAVDDKHALGTARHRAGVIATVRGHSLGEMSGSVDCEGCDDQDWVELDLARLDDAVQMDHSCDV
jgi:hypothetical protein